MPNKMKSRLLRWALEALWIIDPVEPRWWDIDDVPVFVIQGPALAEALRRANHGGRAAA